MTSILDEFKHLDAAHARGEITAMDLALRKAEIMDRVPDALDISEPLDATPGGTPAAATFSLWHGIAITLGFLGFCTLAVTLLVGDAFIALTLSLTLLAALSVRAFINIEDE